MLMQSSVVSNILMQRTPFTLKYKLRLLDSNGFDNGQSVYAASMLSLYFFPDLI